MDDIREIWRAITLESAEFILEQAEKKLNSSVDNAKSLTDRSVHILQFSIPTSIGLIGLIAVEQPREFYWLYVGTLCLMICITSLALKIYILHDVGQAGFRPSYLLSTRNLLLSEKEQRLGFIVSVIERCEKEIALNEEKNLQRQRIFFWTMTLVRAAILFASAYTPLGLFLVWSNEFPL